MTLTYAELFAGAGGMSLGLEAGGFHAAAHAEIEPHARAVEFDEALNTYYTGESGEDHQRWRVYLDALTKAEKALRAAVAALLAAEAAS